LFLSIRSFEIQRFIKEKTCSKRGISRAQLGFGIIRG
jgi:hypothetical protein